MLKEQYIKYLKFKKIIPKLIFIKSELEDIHEQIKYIEIKQIIDGTKNRVWLLLNIFLLNKIKKFEDVL